MSANRAITLDYSQDIQPSRKLLTKAISHYPLLTSQDNDLDEMYKDILNYHLKKFTGMVVLTQYKQNNN